jgi:hypothetical protein
MRNNIGLFANGESHLKNIKLSRRRATPFWRGLIFGLGVLYCTLLALEVHANTTTYTIYLYNSQGVLQDGTAYYDYQKGQVSHLSTGIVIGTVPDLDTGTIFDPNGNDIGDMGKGTTHFPRLLNWKTSCSS